MASGRALEELRATLEKVEAERDALSERLDEARRERAALELEKRRGEAGLAEAQSAHNAELGALRERLEAEASKIKALEGEREATIRAAKAARRREEEFAALQERYDALAAVLEERETIDAARSALAAERAALEAERAELAAERRAFVERCGDLRRARERQERRRALMREQERLLVAESEELEEGWARLSEERAQAARAPRPSAPDRDEAELVKLSHRRLMARLDAFEDSRRHQATQLLDRLSGLEDKLAERASAPRPAERRESVAASSPRRREPSRAARRPRAGARGKASSRGVSTGEEKIKPATTRAAPMPGSGGMLAGLLRQNIALRSES